MYCKIHIVDMVTLVLSMITVEVTCPKSSQRKITNNETGSRMGI